MEPLPVSGECDNERMLPKYYCSFLSFFFFSSRRRHTRSTRDWSSDVCSSDLCEPAPHAPELESDHARADDAEPLRYRLEFERTPGVDDVRRPEGSRAQLDRSGAGGEHHVAGGEPAALALVGGEFDPAAGQQLPVSLERGDAGGLEQRENPLRHGAHDAALALLHLREVKRHARHLDAVRRELLLRPVVQLGRLQQRSEERRVGKECRSRWSADHEKRKKNKSKKEDTYV